MSDLHLNIQYHSVMEGLQMPDVAGRKIDPAFIITASMLQGALATCIWGKNPSLAWAGPLQMRLHSETTYSSMRHSLVQVASENEVLAICCILSCVSNISVTSICITST